MDADRELTSRWRESRALMDAAGAKIGELETFIAKARDEVQRTLQLEAERAMFSAFDPALKLYFAPRSLNHLIRPQQRRPRDREAEGLG